jgi:FlaA1/EpsC-like NDP-sugar epimerase
MSRRNSFANGQFRTSNTEPMSASDLSTFVSEQIKESFSQKLLRSTVWVIVAFQALLVFCSLVFAWLLRFDFSLPYRPLLFSAALLLIVIRLAAMGHFDLFHGWWRFAGISDVLDITKAVLFGSATFFLCLYIILGVKNFPRSVYILEPLITAGLLASVRLVSRVLVVSARASMTPQKKIMLIGAGFAAEMLIRELERQGSGYQVICCVDDDQSKLGIKIHGIPVLGTVDHLPTLLNKGAVDEVLIVVPSATGKQMERFVRICDQAGVKFKTVPTLQDIISGRIGISEFRQVQLEDLLGRNQVEIDLGVVRRQIEGQVVLVTGAAGSIGTELCRQILKHGPGKLLCLDQSETGIFDQQLELAERNNGSHLAFCVADIGDRNRMSAIFAQHKPKVVFHAAAYKHVPVMEANAHEAVKNNVISFLSLLDIAEENSCSDFVLISSDKAVNPTNVMGATKRTGELLISCRPANSMRCVTVRFGNVLGSSGSVVRVFEKQLRNNQPLTVTHPRIKRFFMTTQEAVSLVLQAFTIGEHGDILVLDMGEPVCIMDLAKSLIRLSGKTERQVAIQFTGLRPGEKLQEELFYSTEQVLPTSSAKIKKARGKTVDWSVMIRQLEELQGSLTLESAGPVRAKLKQIVPEYSYAVGREPNEKLLHEASGELEQVSWQS